MRFLFKTSYLQDVRLAKHGGHVFWYGLLVLAMVAAPWLVSEYWLAQLTFILIYSVVGLGLMLLSGFTGLFSLGHAAFIGVGAYTEAALVGAGVPFPLAMAAAGLVSAAVGVVVGLPALRVKGIYLAIATLAFGFIVVEVFDPATNARVVKGYYPDVFTQEGRVNLTEKTRQALDEIEALYDVKDVSRYYLYLGQQMRKEIFPTEIPGVWLKFKNNIGVGAYLNRAIQQIYEPGSVMKPVTMAIAIDQGEVAPEDIYDDTGPVEVDEYTIKNALLSYYGKVDMTDCLEFSINTCMTSVGGKLGKKLFHRMLERFGFGKISGIELDDELPGTLQPWRAWSNALLATTSFGQGISVTPLQMITAWTPLANGGKLMKPTIVDRVIHEDGSEDVNEPKVIDQVLTAQTSETITAMLVTSTETGFAKAGKVKGYRIAGKTGTSQIAGPGGRYETGTGSTIGTYLGYAPPHRPKFLILVKFDRSKDQFGSYTAGPVFKDIAAFLFEYYGIPPDEQ